MELLTGIVVVTVGIPIGLFIGWGLIKIGRRRRRLFNEKVVDRLMEEVEKWEVKL